MKKIDKIDDVKFVNCDSYERDVLLSDKIDELVSAHNSQLEGEGIKCVGVDNCQEIALLRAQVKGLVEALERIASDNGRCINPCLCCGIAKQALNEYKKNR